jgi:hypothetical protein
VTTSSYFECVCDVYVSVRDSAADEYTTELGRYENAANLWSAVAGHRFAFEFFTFWTGSREKA